MKKILSLSLSAAVAALIISGCSGKEEAVVDPTAFVEECVIGGSVAPDWVCGSDLNQSNELYADVGSAPLSKLGEGFSRREAIANGRSNLSQQIETLVKDKVETFTRSTGVGGDEVADKVSTQVSKQVAKQTLSGSRQVGYWQHPSDGTIYIKVAVSKDAIRNGAVNSIKSSFKNDDALWQQFQAKNALEELEKEF